MPLDADELREKDRDYCVRAAEASQQSFDKAILTLAGGALGVSVAFLEHAAGPPPFAAPGLLISAWVSWSLSLLATLTSFYMSTKALRVAINQIDARDTTSRHGRVWSRLTSACNIGAYLLLIIGLWFFFSFAFQNNGVADGQQRQGSSVENTQEANPANRGAPAAAPPANQSGG